MDAGTSGASTGMVFACNLSSPLSAITGAACGFWGAEDISAGAGFSAGTSGETVEEVTSSVQAAVQISIGSAGGVVTVSPGTGETVPWAFLN